jgi:hypothetical protein
MERECPGCRATRAVEAGDPMVAACTCGVTWCWVCRQGLTIERACAAVEDHGTEALGFGSAGLRSLKDRAIPAALAAVHSLCGRSWSKSWPTLAQRLAPQESPVDREAFATTCPAYLELVEHSGVFPDLFDAEDLGGRHNRASWAAVLSGEVSLRK